MTQIHSRIAGTGRYLPEKILTNADLEKMVDTNDAWIVERTGIKRRHIAGDSDTAGTMGVAAAKQALEMAGLEANDIDMIILGTTTPDMTFPSTACIVQHQLGITRPIPAFDVTAACAGFVYGMSIADKFIKTGSAKHVLVIGTEVMSRITNWEDRATCILFADGAGAAIISASDEPGILSTHIHADGQYGPLLSCVNTTTTVPVGQKAIMEMRGNDVFKVAVRTLSQIVDQTLEANQMTKQDVDWLIPHQANIRIIQATAKKLDMPMSQVVVTVHEQGNTSAASIPLALDEAVRDGRVKRGQTLLLETFGAGFAWGSALVKF